MAKKNQKYRKQNQRRKFQWLVAALGGGLLLLAAILFARNNGAGGGKVAYKTFPFEKKTINNISLNLVSPITFLYNVIKPDHHERAL